MYLYATIFTNLAFRPTATYLHITYDCDIMIGTRITTAATTTTTRVRTFVTVYGDVTLSSSWHGETSFANDLDLMVDYGYAVRYRCDHNCFPKFQALLPGGYFCMHCTRIVDVSDKFKDFNKVITHLNEKQIQCKQDGCKRRCYKNVDHECRPDCMCLHCIRIAEL